MSPVVDVQEHAVNTISNRTEVSGERPISHSLNILHQHQKLKFSVLGQFIDISVGHRTTLRLGVSQCFDPMEKRASEGLVNLGMERVAQ